MTAVLLASCEKATDSHVEEIKPTRQGNNNPTPKPPTDQPSIKKCKASSVLNILSNGRTIISSMRMTNEIVAWDIETGKKLGSLNYPVGYQKISPNAQYILRKVNSKKYQVTSFINALNPHKKILTFNASDVPDLIFSDDSKYLLVRYRPQFSINMHKVVLIDLKTMKVTKTLTDRFIRFARLTRDSQSLIMITDNGFEKSLTKIDVASLKQQFKIELPRYQDIKMLSVGLNSIVIKSYRDFLFYNIETGEKLFESDYNYFFSIGAKGETALFANDWDRLKIIDLVTGNELYELDIPEEIYLSSCLILIQETAMLCKSNMVPEKVLRWNLESQKIERHCF